MTAPRSVGTAHRGRSSCGVVAVPDDDGVVSNAGLLDRIEHLAGAVVELGERVRIDATARLALEVRMVDERRVHLRERDIGEERLTGRGIACDEVGRAHRNLFIQQRARREVEVLNRFDRRALHALPDFRHGIARFGEQRVGAERGLVGGVLDAEPFIETLIRRQPAFGLADVPLPERGGRISGIGEQLAERVLPRGEPVVALPGQRHAAVAGANGQTAGQQRRARRRALCLDVVVLEPQSLRGQGIDPWRRGNTAVAADVPPAHVVADDEDDVGLVRHDGWCVPEASSEPA